MPAKGHRQTVEARARIAAARRSERHSADAKAAISRGMRISHAIRSVVREDDRRREELRARGHTEAEIEDDFRDRQARRYSLDTPEWRASWYARGATDQEIDAALAHGDPDGEKWRRRWRARGAIDTQINEAIQRVEGTGGRVDDD